MKYKTLLTIWLLSLSSALFATHTKGGYITYKPIGSTKIEVSYAFYRDCNGLAFNTPGNCKIECKDSGFSTNLSLTLKSITDVSNYHDSVSTCSPQNTTNAGPGVERLVYTATVDFTLSQFSRYATCCKIQFTSSLCCRSNSINSGPSGNFYNYTEVDLCKVSGNYSPQVYAEPSTISCCNQPFYYSDGILDIIDHDSLSFHWAKPLTNWNVPATYNGNYSYVKPFDVYYPGSLTWPYANPNVSPPIGLFLNPENGEIIFTPVKCDEVTIAVYEVKEWRKDSNGIYQHIGSIRVEKLFDTRSCPDNNPPTIDGPYQYEVCAGNTLCFDIETDDKPFIPPPPASPPAGDSVFISWNQGIRAASFTIIQDSLHQNGRFCWTTKKEDARSIPYSFSVYASDNHGPLNATTARTFRVYVRYWADSNITITPLTCSLYEVTSQPATPIYGTPYYVRTILDSSGTLITDPGIAEFKSSGSSVAFYGTDTFAIGRAGTYIIHSSSCPEEYFDTIVVNNPMEVHIDSNDVRVCQFDTAILEGRAENASGKVSYQWYHADTALSGETDSVLNVYVDYLGTKDFWLVAEDQNGCRAKWMATAGTNPQTYPILEDSSISCMEDTVHFSIDPNLTYKSVWWSTGTSSFRTFSTSTQMVYLEIEDLNSCDWIDSSYTFFVPTPTFDIVDTVICDSSYRLDPGYFLSYSWNTGENTRIIEVDTTAEYEVTVRDEHNCYHSKKVLIEFIDHTNLEVRDTTVCQDDYELFLNNLINKPSDPSKGKIWWSCIECFGNIEDSVLYNHGDSAKSNFAFRLKKGTYHMASSDSDIVQLGFQYTDENACTNADTMLLTILSQGWAPKIGKNKHMLGSDIANVQWYRNDSLLVGQISDSIDASIIGIYKARKLRGNGCWTEFSNEISHTASLVPVLKQDHLIYPNPSRGEWTIITTKPIGQLKVLNQLGQEINFSLEEMHEAYELKLHEPDGVYQLYYEIDGSRFNRKLLLFN
ncbi:MAG: hypothetical protein JXR19_08430 [Bacteroidia bacterium]